MLRTRQGTFLLPCHMVQTWSSDQAEEPIAQPCPAFDNTTSQLHHSTSFIPHTQTASWRLCASLDYEIISGVFFGSFSRHAPFSGADVGCFFLVFLDTLIINIRFTSADLEIGSHETTYSRPQLGIRRLICDTGLRRFLFPRPSSCRQTDASARLDRYLARTPQQSLFQHIISSGSLHDFLRFLV